MARPTPRLRRSSIFWGITTCKPLRVNLPPTFTLVSWSIYPSTLKVEAIYYSETSVDFQRATRRCISQKTELWVFVPVSLKFLPSRVQWKSNRYESPKHCADTLWILPFLLYFT
jgi:hypothetical protein